jgi:hydroxymethylbilane synthase
MVKHSDRIIVGTRGSRLARRQTNVVIGLLREAFPGVEIILKVVQTEADRLADKPVWQLGDKGVFVRAIERSLLAEEVDMAVHSLKDVPVDRETQSLSLAAFPEREDARDVLVTHENLILENLPEGYRIGTSSPRRRVQLRELRPDVLATEIRGNVDTRLQKLDNGQYDALLLAAAGLRRLGLDQRVSEYLNPSSFVPDAGQGILGVQIREGDARMEMIAAALDNCESRIAATAERAVVRALGADCHSPVGAFATCTVTTVSVTAIAASGPEGRIHRDQIEAPLTKATEAGTILGERLLEAIAGGN